MQTTAIHTPDGIDTLITADEAATLCNVSVVTVRNWANRGYLARDGQRQALPVAGLDRAGRNLYRLLEVAKAERATRDRARRACA